MAWVGLAASAVSALGAISQGAAQAQALGAQASALESQAKFTEFSGRQKALEHRKRAADELEKTLMIQARINAQAGAGNLDPFSGNPGALKIRALSVGGTNFAMAKGNERITQRLAKTQADFQRLQASQARNAARQVKTQAFFKAASTIGQGAMNFYQSSIPTPSITPSFNYSGFNTPMNNWLYPG
jgi:hypothetical protein